MSRLIILLFLLIHSVHGAYLLLGPMVGHVGEDYALIWCGLDSEGKVTLQISENSNLKNAREVVVDNFEMGSIKVDGLKPNKKYYYTVFANDYSKRIIYHFKTSPLEGHSGVVRFLFSSCSGYSGMHEDSSWDEINKIKNVDLIFQLGDNHYADTTNPEVISKHYFSHRSTLGFRQATAHIPTYGIWDDHDYGPNNSDGQTAGKEKSLMAFKQHWANPFFGESDNPGIYFNFVRGDVEFIFLDSRYHRTPNKSKAVDDPSKTLLGETQLAWLEKTLKSSKAKIKVVACGSEFQMFSTNDCFSGFKHEQKKVLDLCRDVEGVMLISGDRHFTAGYHVRGETIEITSGPLGSKSYSSRPNPSMFAHHSSGKMFSVLEVNTQQNPPVVNWEVHDTAKGIIQERLFTWEEINGKKQIPPLARK